MTDNRRGAFRKNAFTFGAVLLASGKVSCLIWDTTETGAQIELEADCTVPDRFPLQLTEDGEPRPVTVAWRRGRRIGVAFDV